MKIIPKPVNLHINEGFYRIGKVLRIKSIKDEKIWKTYSIFSEELQKLSEISIEFTSEKEVDLNFSFDEKITHDEGYSLSINTDGIQIKAKKPAGIFYACQTLLQILFQHFPKIPFCEIDDFPRFEWRGMHLDVSRHFFDAAFIKKYIDLLALHKLNIFHWHLTDDNGWRIQIEKYPELTKICAWRNDLEHITWNKRQGREDEAKGIYGGFYTKKNIREIVEYAAERLISIVPEIEMPGHTSEVFAAFPEFSCKGKKLTVAPGGYWPNMDIFCAGNDDTFQFLKNILTEVCELFPSKYIHIGGDEANRIFWKECPKCQIRIADEGLKDEKELQSWFIRKIEKFLQTKRKKLIGWDEISEGGLTRDATVMCWRGDGIDAVKNAVSHGNKAVMCPNFFLYFDWKQTEAESEQGAFGVTTLEKVYSYEPVPADLPGKQQKLILGAQGNVWTEFMRNPEEVEYMVFPRMCALAEIVWTQKEMRDWGEFQARLGKHVELICNQKN